MITLKTLGEATAQEVFDQVKNHLLSQNRPSINNDDKCKYRLELEDGTVLKCAAGCLIADDEYDPTMDQFDTEKGMGNTWRSIVRRYGINTKHTLLIRDLQGVHDGIKPEKWSEKLKLVADIYNLKYDNTEDIG